MGTIIQNLRNAMQAPWLRRWQNQAQVDGIDQSIGQDGFYAQNVAGTSEMHVIGYDADDQFRLADVVSTPQRSQVTVHIYPNASLATTAFFVNPTPRPIHITGIQMVMTTAGTVAGASAKVTHEINTGGTLPTAGSGATVMSGTFNVHGTAETVQVGTLGVNYLLATRNNNSAIVLQPGDVLSLVMGGTLTTAVGLTITLAIAPGGKYHFVSYYASAAGAGATASIITSMRKRSLLYGAAVWGVAESTAATLTLTVTKDGSATAPGGGTAMLASTINLKGAALTYKQMALSATAANLLTGPTDSVAIKLSTTPTELAGLLVTLAFDGKQGEIQLDYNSANSTVGTSEEFWIADRDYEVLDFAAKWSHVGTSNFIALTSDGGTQAPSAGQVLQTDNTNTGFDTTGTINVPAFATLSAPNTRFLRAGDRLGLLNTGTVTGLAGFQLSARLRVM